MKFTRTLFVSVLLLILAQISSAQWTNISTGKINPIARTTSLGGALSYRSGQLWYAWENKLWMTADLGATWALKGPNIISTEIITDIDFFDASVGAVATTNGVYVTANAGTSWTKVNTSSGSGNVATGVRFIRTSQELVITYILGPVLFSANRGGTWGTITPAGGSDYFTLATKRTGEIFVTVNVTQKTKVSRVAISTNNGSTWQLTSQGLDYDDWQMALDSCTNNIICVMNEETFANADATSCVFFTADKGISWQAQASVNSITAYAGGLSMAKGGVLFVQKVRGGRVIRTNDDGQNWKNIGGPSGVYDSRTVCAVSKDTIFAVDSLADVWLTTNSGGFPVSYNSRAQISFSPDTLFKNTKTQLCDSLIRSLHILHNCSVANMTAAFLEGSYGGDYTILSQNGDSVVILFKPSGVGVRDADVRLSFDDGTLFTMPIAGTGKDTGYKVAITPGSLFYRDSLLTCDSISRGLRFSISGCLIPGNYNASITGISAADYYAYFVGTDSVVVTFHPRGGGVRNAFFTLLFSDGKSFQIPLLGFGIDPGPALAATPDELFNGDSILTCRTLTKGFAVSSNVCVNRVLLSQGVNGLASGDYTIIKQLPSVLTGMDSVVIKFAPSIPGARTASYDIVLGDSTKISVPLLGKGINPGAGLTATRSKLFETDSLLFCKQITRGFRVRSGACADRTIVTQAITGAASGDYVLKLMAANPLKAVDTIAITFTPTASGLRQAVYTLTLSDSSSITVSLEGTGIDPGPALSVTPPTLFDNDSIALCSQISRGMRVRSNACASKNVILEQISGAASGDYKIVKAAPDPLTGSDSVTILFTPTAGGVRNAQYELQVGAEKLTVPLAGKAYYPAYNFSFSTPSLFDSDTLSVCEKTQASFHITSSGCVVPKVASQTIAGAAPNDYLLLSVAPDSLTGDDVVTVQFAPGAFGARDAQYEITLSDGKKYVVYLKGTGKDGVYTITASPKILFEKDSLYSCEDAEHTADITLSGCTSIRAGSQTIIGAASTDYTLVTKAPDSLAGTNTIRIHFKPTAPGMRDAMYRLTLSDGKTLDITLSGYGKATETLSFSTVPSISTVVIGDDISVPITINGFSSSPLLRLSLAFDSVNLVYHGTRSAKGTMLDVAGTTTAASSQIEIPAGELQTGQVSAYANFNLYVDTEKVSSVTVSNLQVFGAESPCQYIVNNGSYETTIAGPTGCGTVVISDYLRYNNIPGLRIYPNPASGSFTIVSSEALGMARFEITDKLGIVHRSEQVLLGERGSSVKFDAGGLASGLYFVRIIAGPFNTALPVVIEK